MVFYSKLLYHTSQLWHQASDEVIENEIEGLLIVVQIRLLSFVLRKEAFSLPRHYEMGP